MVHDDKKIFGKWFFLLMRSKGKSVDETMMGAWFELLEPYNIRQVVMAFNRIIKMIDDFPTVGKVMDILGPPGEFKIEKVCYYCGKVMGPYGKCGFCHTSDTKKRERFIPGEPMIFKKEMDFIDKRLIDANNIKKIK